jgi:hypothetical protein
LYNSDLDPGDRGWVSQMFITGDAQKRYLRNMEHEDVASMSRHRAGTLFESKYSGVFRRLYLERMFGEGTHSEVNAWITGMIGS